MPTNAVFVVCPLPSEIMLLLISVVTPPPSLMKIPDAVPGRVVEVAVLALLRPEILFLVMDIDVVGNVYEIPPKL